MPTFWSKLGIRGRNNGMQEEVGKLSTAKKKKKSKKSSSRSYVSSSLHDENLYENETSEEYNFNVRDSSRMCTDPMEYEDIAAGMLMEPKATDYNTKGHKSTAVSGGISHYMPKATQHLILSSLLEGQKIDDYFQDCRLDSALQNFARFDIYEQPVIDSEPSSPLVKENLYETIEPDSPTSQQPTVANTERKATRKPSDKLDIMNWPTDPIITSSPVAFAKQRRAHRAALNCSVDSAGEDLDDEDNYVDVQDHSIDSQIHAHTSGPDDSFDSSPWCSGVDVLY